MTFFRSPTLYGTYELENDLKCRESPSIEEEKVFFSA